MTKPNANGSNRTIIHISLQGKGGVGKSLVAAILSQYLAWRGQDVHGIDADPVNHTLSEYRGIGAGYLRAVAQGPRSGFENQGAPAQSHARDRKSTRLNSSHRL